MSLAMISCRGWIMDDRSQDSNARDGPQVARWCNFGCRTNRSSEKTFCQNSCRVLGLLNFHTGGVGDLVRGNFWLEEFSAGKIPPQSSQVMGKIAPHFSMVKGKA